MKAFAKFLGLTTASMIFCLGARSQSGDECKFLMVLTYLRTNSQIIDHIKSFFPGAAQKRDKFVEIQVCEGIQFLGISLFKDELSKKDYGISKELITDGKLYREKYYFPSYYSTFLKKIAPVNESKLYLTFSRPIDNYEVVEIGNVVPVMEGRKFGKALRIFFEFDSDGTIEEVLYARSVYN